MSDQQTSEPLKLGKITLTLEGLIAAFREGGGSPICATMQRNYAEFPNEYTERMGFALPDGPECRCFLGQLLHLEGKNAGSAENYDEAAAILGVPHSRAIEPGGYNLSMVYGAWDAGMDPKSYYYSDGAYLHSAAPPPPVIVALYKAAKEFYAWLKAGNKLTPKPAPEGGKLTPPEPKESM